MDFQLDENMPSDVADLLGAAGHDAATASDQRLLGRGDDSVAARCRSQGRLLITHDLDFADVRRF
jgi:predicted nuclease of predicted toxin-antitoxin system